jgi:hypothetical protein
MLDIATSLDQKQLSPRLFDNLGFQPVIINGDLQKLALLDQHIQTILKIGDLEHTGDWDPFLVINTEKQSFETAAGYPEIIFGDFNDEEQETALRHYSEITNIGFYLEDEEDDESDEPILTWIPAKDILTIQLMR